MIDLIKLSKETDNREFRECLKSLEDAKRFGKLEEYIKAVNEMEQEADLASAMYYAWMDLFIDPIHGNFYDEYKKLLPMAGEKTNY